MIKVRELKSKDSNIEDIIAIYKKTSIDYYTYDEAKKIKRRLNELFPED